MSGRKAVATEVSGSDGSVRQEGSVRQCRTRAEQAEAAMQEEANHCDAVVQYLK